MRRRFCDFCQNEMPLQPDTITVEVTTPLLSVDRWGFYAKTEGNRDICAICIKAAVERYLGGSK